MIATTLCRQCIVLDNNGPMYLKKTLQHTSKSVYRTTMTCSVLFTQLGVLYSTGESPANADLRNEPTSSESFVEANPLFLAALRVMLMSEYDGGTGSPWLESTKHLSLASLNTCEECREAAAAHVRIADDTPCSLWMVQTNGNDHKSKSTTSNYVKCHETSQAPVKASRIPVARVIKITWDKSSVYGMTDSCKGHVTWWSLCQVSEIVFGDAFNQPVHDVAWPKGVKRLVFGCSFNQPVRDVSWPPALLELSFGKSFDRPIDGVTWPRNLQRLLFGYAFSQSCASVVWPKSLRELTFGQQYNNPLTEIVWPISLKRLSFGRTFNQSIGRGVHWPAGLTTLTFGWHFDQHLNGVALPSTLEVLSIAGVYDKPLDNVEFPKGLKKLTLGGHFNQPLDVVRMPDQLEEISFGWAFNQPLLKVTWPLKLSKISLGYRFNQPATSIKWPRTLEELDLGVFSRQSLEGLVWPPYFRTLTVSRGFDLTGMALPKGSRVCRRGYTYCKAHRDMKRW